MSDVRVNHCDGVGAAHLQPLDGTGGAAILAGVLEILATCDEGFVLTTRARNAWAAGTTAAGEDDGRERLGEAGGGQMPVTEKSGKRTRAQLAADSLELHFGTTVAIEALSTHTTRRVASALHTGFARQVTVGAVGATGMAVARLAGGATHIAIGDAPACFASCTARDAFAFAAFNTLGMALASDAGTARHVAARNATASVAHLAQVAALHARVKARCA